MKKKNRTRQPGERSALFTWVTLVVLLLGLQLTIGGIAITIATSDRSAAIVPDYHEAALSWDADRASRRRMKDLNWSFDYSISETEDLQGRRALQVWVKDSEGKGVDELPITVTLFHHALAKDAVTLEPESIGNGVYQCLAPVGKPGLWEFDFQFQALDEPARVKQTLEVR